MRVYKYTVYNMKTKMHIYIYISSKLTLHLGLVVDVETVKKNVARLYLKYLPSKYISNNIINSYIDKTVSKNTVSATQNRFFKYLCKKE